MIERKVTVVVLGAGTAGLAAYRAAKKHTSEVLLINGGPYGTTCARVGCMPSKLLIAAAHSRHEVERADKFGVRVPAGTSVDGKAVMARVRSERDRFVGFVLRGVESIPAEDKLDGYAAFEGPHTIVVRREPSPQSELIARISAERVVIATGSSPAIPPPFRNFGSRLIVNDDVFEWQDLPESVALFGPGVIGLELGQALHRLGVRLRMFGVGNLVGPLSDPPIAEYARKTFGEEFYLDADAKVEEMGVEGERARIVFIDKQGERRTETFDYVIAATGRSPNVRGLGLEHTGLALDARGMPLFDPSTMRCGESHIFIAGDANNDRPLLHEASDEGKIAGENAGAFPKVQPGLRRAGLGVVFSEPQIAVVGPGHRALLARHGAELVTGEVSFEDQGRSRVMLVNKGLMHVYADRASGRFLGAEFLGPQAEHLAHLLSWALQKEMTVSEMLDMPFYHPVIEEGLRTALRDLDAKLRTP